MSDIDVAYIDFRMEDEEFAHTLYGQWDGFCRIAFEKVVEEVLAHFDRDGQFLCFEEIKLDLGTLTETDFYEKFPVRLAEQLQGFLKEYFFHRQEDLQIQVTVDLREQWSKWLIRYLLEGILGWEVPGEYRDLSGLLGKILAGDARNWVAALRYHGHLPVLRQRLVLQFSDEELEKVVAVTEPSEAGFISYYTRFLLNRYAGWKHPETSRENYRNVVWVLVFAYLLHDGKDFFSRKQFVYRTIVGLAAHYNVSFARLLEQLTSGLRQVMALQVVSKELLQILSEINQEQLQVYTGEEMKALRTLVLETKDEIPGDQIVMLRKWLVSQDSCRQVLKDLPEEKIFILVRLVIPAGSDFIIDYARVLEQGQQQGMFEGKAGGEFRLLKWEFIFQVVLSDPGNRFDRKRFVREVLLRLANHYNLDLILLLEFFRVDSLDIPVWISEILTLLYYEESESDPLQLLDNEIYRELTPDERQHLLSVLIHPASCRLFLSRLPEEKIEQLVRAMLPLESTFVIVYARSLQSQQEKGMFEGKAGADFRLVKWEFILGISLLRPFSQKQLVYSVLQQLALHYNLVADELLEYFYHGLVVEKEKGIPEWLITVIAELQAEIKEKKRISELEQQHGRMQKLACMEEFLLTGFQRVSLDELNRVLEYLCRLAPAELRKLTERFRDEFREIRLVSLPDAVRFYATYFLWVIRYYGLAFAGRIVLETYLEEIRRGNISVRVELLRKLIYACLSDDKEGFQAILEELYRESSTDREVVPDSKNVTFDEKVRNGHTLLNEEKSDNTSIQVSKAERKQLNQQLVEQWINTGNSLELLEVLEHKAEDMRAVWLNWKGQGQLVSDWLKNNRILRITWIVRMGNGVVRMVAEELYRLEKLLDFRPDPAVYEMWLVEFTSSRFANYSLPELLVRLLGRFREWLSPERWEKMKRVIRGNPAQPEFWKKALGVVEVKEIGMPELKNVIVEEHQDRFFIHNAGLVLLSPWFPRLFDRLKLLENPQAFVGDQAKMKAVFALQYLVTEEEEQPEFELVLNKLLAGMMVLNQPLPRTFVWKVEEKELLQGMMAGVKQNWEKMKHTSLQNFQASFLKREGILQEREEYWHLQVENKAYDMLLDSLPWGYTPVKYQWMNKPILVDWR